MAEMVLLLKDGKSWAAPGADPEKPVSIFVTKVDTGAGEVVMEDDGAVVARVFQDPSGAVCDDSCEWALDGGCEQGTDCTDCGGADPDASPTECSNTCQWANDNY